MPFPRVIPHSDGAGTIDALGAGVRDDRLGTRVWCYGAQSYRPFGTAAEYVVVPEALAVPLPAGPTKPADHLDEQGACLGIPGITAHRGLFADGPTTGRVVLIHGVAGGVGSIAAQLARRDGATVIGVVHRNGQRAAALRTGAQHVVTNDDPRLAERIRELAPDGVHRILDVDFASHIDLAADVLATGGHVSSISTSEERPRIPYWALGFKDTTIRLLGSDDFPPAAKAAAATTLTAALLDRSLRCDIAARFALTEISSAHELVEQGAPGRVIIHVRSSSS
jgi:NADPH2:quinone reductase